MVIQSSRGANAPTVSLSIDMKTLPTMLSIHLYFLASLTIFISQQMLQMLPCALASIQIFLSCVFFKFVAVEWRAIIRFHHFRYSVGIKYPSEHGNGCFFTGGSHKFNHWVSGVLAVEHKGEVSVSQRSAEVHTDLSPRSLWQLRHF